MKLSSFNVCASMGILCIFALATVMMVKVHWRRRERNWGEEAGHLLEKLADLLNTLMHNGLYL